MIAVYAVVAWLALVAPIVTVARWLRSRQQLH